MASIVPQQETGSTDEGFRWLEPDEERVLFDELARSIMQISGDEFLQRLDRGEYDDELAEDDNRDLAYLAMLANLGR